MLLFFAAVAVIASSSTMKTTIRSMTFWYLFTSFIPAAPLKKLRYRKEGFIYQLLQEQCANKELLN